MRDLVYIRIWDIKMRYKNVRYNYKIISYCKDIAKCISENAFWFAAWRWLYKEAETCRRFDYLLIMFYTKRLKTCIHFVNYWKHKADASPDNHEHPTSSVGGVKIRWSYFYFIVCTRAVSSSEFALSWNIFVCSHSFWYLKGGYWEGYLAQQRRQMESGDSK